MFDKMDWVVTRVNILIWLVMRWPSVTPIGWRWLWYWITNAMFYIVVITWCLRIPQILQMSTNFIPITITRKFKKTNPVCWTHQTPCWGSKKRTMLKYESRKELERSEVKLKLEGYTRHEATVRKLSENTLKKTRRHDTSKPSGRKERTFTLYIKIPTNPPVNFLKSDPWYGIGRTRLWLRGQWPTGRQRVQVLAGWAFQLSKFFI